MDTKTREALEALDTTARQIAKLFVKKYYSYNLEADYVYAVADDPIGAWGVGDEFWSFDDMVTALRYNADKDTLMEWYEHQLDSTAPGKLGINLKSWLKDVRPEGFYNHKQAEAKK